MGPVSYSMAQNAIFLTPFLVSWQGGGCINEPRERPVEIELKPVPSVSVDEEVAA
jgi:hypothetical protein